jgi:hypothetical protein
VAWIPLSVKAGDDDDPGGLDKEEEAVWEAPNSSTPAISGDGGKVQRI